MAFGVQISLSFATLQKLKSLNHYKTPNSLVSNNKFLTTKVNYYFSLSSEMGTRQDISFDEYLNLVHIDEQTYIAVLHS
jgi:hypothetical protein